MSLLSNIINKVLGERNNISFDEYIKDFPLVNSTYIEKSIKDKKDFILFLGRETCPFCQKFAPKISNVSKKVVKEVFFLNSEDFSDENIPYFREKYNIQTVPALIVSKDENVNVVCDSSLTEEEIISFIKE